MIWCTWAQLDERMRDRDPAYEALVMHLLCAANDEGFALSDESVEILRNRFASRGMGDWVADRLQRVGIAAAVHAVWPNCGCAARQALLNELMPFAH